MSQYQTVAIPTRFPLVIDPQNRDGSTAKDSKLVNCYLEVEDEETVNIYKRPGMLDVGQPPGGAQTGNGIFNWNGDIFSIFADRLYKNGVAVTGTIDNTGGVYRFNSILGIAKLVFGNGKEMYTYNDASGIVGPINSISPDFPKPFVKGSAYLNGALYVMNSASKIFGSTINVVDQASSWESINFLLAQIEPDAGTALAKQLVYVIAFNEWSTEVFFDAGNPTASPLESVQGAKTGFGCVSSDSVQSIDDVLFWLAHSQSAGIQIARMVGLNTTIVSTPSIDRLLDQADFSVVYSWQFKHAGHTFYVITLKNSNLTLAFDTGQQRWCQFTTFSGGYLPIVSATSTSDGVQILQHESNGRVYWFDSSYYTDAGEDIGVDIITPSWDAGTRRRKHLNTLEVVADQQKGGVLEIRKSDDDFQTWSTFRKVDLGSKKPLLTGCGTFVKRAYHLRYTKPTPFRISALELQIDIGTL